MCAHYVRGVHAVQKSEKFNMRIDPEFTETLDEWRRHQRGIPSRAEAIRRLVDRGILFDALYEQLRILVADGLMPEQGFLTIMDRIGYDARLDMDAPEEPPPPRRRSSGNPEQLSIPGMTPSEAWKAHNEKIAALEGGYAHGSHRNPKKP